MKNILLFILSSLTIAFGASTITLYAKYQEVVSQVKTSPSKNEPIPFVVKNNLGGQIFVVTRDGDSLPLGGVMISIHRLNEFKKIIVPLQKVVAVDVVDLAPRLITMHQDIISTMERDKKRGYRSEKESDKKMAEFEKMIFARNELLRNLVNSSSGERYLSSLQAPFLTTQSDASGKFNFTLPSNTEWVVATCTSREVGKREERYCWFVTVDGSKDILLNNHNMFGRMSEDSAIKMPEIATSCTYNDVCIAYSNIMNSVYSKYLSSTNKQ
jgi:hypothetical protein